ncbi:MAG TPA: hypothetical protein ENI29_14970 [bacterium]|nr:hypothetical protein [bacterium]
MIMKHRLLVIGVIILLTFNMGIILGQDDPAPVSVEVDGNDVEKFYDLDLDDIDHMSESDRTPLPNVTVVITVQIDYQDNTSGELDVKLYHDDGTGKASWLNQTMIYYAGSDIFNTSLGGYVEDTRVYYYVLVDDGGIPARSPEDPVQYVYLDWDTPVVVVEVPAGGGGETVIIIPGLDVTLDRSMFLVGVMVVIIIIIAFLWIIFYYKQKEEKRPKKRRKDSVSIKGRKKRKVNT